MALELKTAAATPVVSTADMKAHLNVGHANDDTYIAALVGAAVTHLDGRGGILNRALITQHWYLHLDAFPRSSAAPIRLPLPPLQSVTAITYVDTDGATQTWASSKWTEDTASEPSRILPAYDEVYPSTRSQANAVTIEFKAGYGDSDSDVPGAIVMAVKQLVGHWYENREAVTAGTMITETPLAVDRLITPYRVRTEF